MIMINMMLIMVSVEGRNPMLPIFPPLFLSHSLILPPEQVCIIYEAPLFIPIIYIYTGVSFLCAFTVKSVSRYLLYTEPYPNTPLNVTPVIIFTITAATLLICFYNYYYHYKRFSSQHQNYTITANQYLN